MKVLLKLRRDFFRLTNFMRVIKVVFFIFLLFLFFSFGFLSYRQQNFIYKTIASVYYFFELEKPMLDSENYQKIKSVLYSQEFLNYQESYAREIYDSIKKDPVSFRNQLLKVTILPKEIVTIKKEQLKNNYEFQNLIPNKSFKSLDNKFLIKVKYYGIEHFGVLEKTDKNNKKLFVYHGGQGPSRIPLEYDNFLELNEELRKNGYDILSLSISGIGYNHSYNKNINFPSNPNLKTYPDSINKSFDFWVTGNNRYLRHIWLPFFDKNYPELFPISLMLSGNYYIIKKLENDYDEIIMAGLSGGAWQTTMTSSLIAKIKYSYAFAGSIPKAFADPGWNPHALMSGTSKFWYDYDIWHFYFLSLFDVTGIQNRKHNLIYGNKDRCCFFPPYSSSFKKVIDGISVDGLNAFLLKENDHNIDIDFLKKKLLTIF